MEFVAVLLAALGIGACERDSQPAAEPSRAVTPDSPVSFPSEVQSDDPAVNEFVRKITHTCVDGDYEEFRLLWAVREDPFPRQEFERGRNALETIRIADLRKMKTLQGEYLYYIHARIELDDSVPKPARDVVLLIVQEDDRWRLARAPEHLRQKILGIANEETVEQTATKRGGALPPADPTPPGPP